jgi:DNA ligase D-like protein (predicted 3'-phosphoesterase)
MKHSTKIRLLAMVSTIGMVPLWAGDSMTGKDSLTQYRQRRNLKKSGEPAGKKVPSSRSMKFVVQKHAASHLHYDFRLEIDSVLKSWAVPKGPSQNPHEKHLAVPTDDHPMEYANFEGVIPEGNYGAGTVMIWDKGTYKNIKEKDGKLVPMDECYKDGHIEMVLKGKKMHGAYALVRTHLAGGDQWLLIKMNDEYASTKPFAHDDTSVKTGRTLKQIADDGAKKTGKTSKKKRMAMS